MVAKATAEIKPRKKLPPTALAVHRRHVGAAQQRAGGVFERRIGADQQDGAEADNKGQDIEVTDKTGGVEHALARFFGVTHGKEAHQDVRQTGGAEHQRGPSDSAEIGSETKPPGS